MKNAGVHKRDVLAHRLANRSNSTLKFTKNNAELRDLTVYGSHVKKNPTILNKILIHILTC